jgi:putative DNA primase/helicase
MKARFMRGDFFEWAPTHKLFLAANHRPVIRGTDYAIWRRIHLVPFTVTIPEDERDGHLPEKLRAELPGILNWAIEGCLDWQRNGLGVPQVVKDATAEYRAEQDILGDFLAEKCVKDPQAWVPSGLLYKAYTGWCEDNGEKPITKTGFGIRLTERGFVQGKAAKGVRVWRCLRLLAPDETPTGGAFDGGGAFGRDFSDESSNRPCEDDMPKNAPNAPPPSNAPPAPDPVVCSDCGTNGVDLPGLACDECLGVAR